MPSAGAAYDVVAEQYDTHLAAAWWRVSDHLTWRAVEPALAGGPKRVLDVGSGTGRFALRFLEAGHHVTLLEPSAAMLDVARRRVAQAGVAPRARFLRASLDAMGLRGGGYDLVFAEGDPLSYCTGTRREAAEEILRVLRPGGAFYAACDNRRLATLAFLSMGRVEDARGAAEEGRSLDPYGNPVHAFEPRELRALFVEAGAVDVRVAGKPSLSHLLPPGALDRVLADEAARAWLLALEERLAADESASALAGHLHATGRRAP